MLDLKAKRITVPFLLTSLLDNKTFGIAADAVLFEAIQNKRKGL